MEHLFYLLFCSSQDVKYFAALQISKLFHPIPRYNILTLYFPSDIDSITIKVDGSSIDSYWSIADISIHEYKLVNKDYAPDRVIYLNDTELVVNGNKAIITYSDKSTIELSSNNETKNWDLWSRELRYRHEDLTRERKYRKEFHPHSTKDGIISFESMKKYYNFFSDPSKFERLLSLYPQPGKPLFVAPATTIILLEILSSYSQFPQDETKPPSKKIERSVVPALFITPTLCKGWWKAQALLMNNGKDGAFIPKDDEDVNSYMNKNALVILASYTKETLLEFDDIKDRLLPILVKLLSTATNRDEGALIPFITRIVYNIFKKIGTDQSLINKLLPIIDSLFHELLSLDYVQTLKARTAIYIELDVLKTIQLIVSECPILIRIIVATNLFKKSDFLNFIMYCISDSNTSEEAKSCLLTCFTESKIEQSLTDDQIIVLLSCPLAAVVNILISELSQRFARKSSEVYVGELRLFLNAWFTIVEELYLKKGNEQSVIDGAKTIYTLVSDNNIPPDEFEAKRTFLGKESETILHIIKIFGDDNSIEIKIVIGNLIAYFAAFDYYVPIILSKIISDRVTVLPYLFKAFSKCKYDSDNLHYLSVYCKIFYSYCNKGSHLASLTNAKLLEPLSVILNRYKCEEETRNSGIMDILRITSFLFQHGESFPDWLKRHTPLFKQTMKVFNNEKDNEVLLCGIETFGNLLQDTENIFRIFHIIPTWFKKLISIINKFKMEIENEELAASRKSFRSNRNSLILAKGINNNNENDESNNTISLTERSKNDSPTTVSAVQFTASSSSKSTMKSTMQSPSTPKSVKKSEIETKKKICESGLELIRNIFVTGENAEDKNVLYALLDNEFYFELLEIEDTPLQYVALKVINDRAENGLFPESTTIPNPIRKLPIQYKTNNKSSILNTWTKDSTLIFTENCAYIYKNEEPKIKIKLYGIIVEEKDDNDITVVVKKGKNEIYIKGNDNDETDNIYCHFLYASKGDVYQPPNDYKLSTINESKVANTTPQTPNNSIIYVNYNRTLTLTEENIFVISKFIAKQMNVVNPYFKTEIAKFLKISSYSTNLTEDQARINSVYVEKLLLAKFDEQDVFDANIYNSVYEDNLLFCPLCYNHFDNDRCDYCEECGIKFESETCDYFSVQDGKVTQDAIYALHHALLSILIEAMNVYIDHEDYLPSLKLKPFIIQCDAFNVPIFCYELPKLLCDIFDQETKSGEVLGENEIEPYFEILEKLKPDIIPKKILPVIYIRFGRLYSQIVKYYDTVCPEYIGTEELKQQNKILTSQYNIPQSIMKHGILNSFYDSLQTTCVEHQNVLSECIRRIFLTKQLIGCNIKYLIELIDCTVPSPMLHCIVLRIMSMLKEKIVKDKYTILIDKVELITSQLEEKEEVVAIEVKRKKTFHPSANNSFLTDSTKDLLDKLNGCDIDMATTIEERIAMKYSYTDGIAEEDSDDSNGSGDNEIRLPKPVLSSIEEEKEEEEEDKPKPKVEEKPKEEDKPEAEEKKEEDKPKEEGKEGDEKPEEDEKPKEEEEKSKSSKSDDEDSNDEDFYKSINRNELESTGSNEATRLLLSTYKNSNQKCKVINRVNKKDKLSPFQYLIGALVNRDEKFIVLDDNVRIAIADLIKLVCSLFKEDRPKHFPEYCRSFCFEDLTSYLSHYENMNEDLTVILCTILDEILESDEKLSIVFMMIDDECIVYDLTNNFNICLINHQSRSLGGYIRLFSRLINTPYHIQLFMQANILKTLEPIYSAISAIDIHSKRILTILYQLLKRETVDVMIVEDYPAITKSILEYFNNYINKESRTVEEVECCEIILSILNLLTIDSWNLLKIYHNYSNFVSTIANLLTMELPISSLAHQIICNVVRIQGDINPFIEHYLSNSDLLLILNKSNDPGVISRVIQILADRLTYGSQPPNDKIQPATSKSAQFQLTFQEDLNHAKSSCKFGSFKKDYFITLTKFEDPEVSYNNSTPNIQSFAESYCFYLMDSKSVRPLNKVFLWNTEIHTQKKAKKKTIKLVFCDFDTKIGYMELNLQKCPIEPDKIFLPLVQTSTTLYKYHNRMARNNPYRYEYESFFLNDTGYVINPPVYPYITYKEISDGNIFNKLKYLKFTSVELYDQYIRLYNLLEQQMYVSGDVSEVEPEAIIPPWGEKPVLPFIKQIYPPYESTPETAMAQICIIGEEGFVNPTEAYYYGVESEISSTFNISQDVFVYTDTESMDGMSLDGMSVSSRTGRGSLPGFKNFTNDGRPGERRSLGSLQRPQSEAIISRYKRENSMVDNPISLDTDIMESESMDEEGSPSASLVKGKSYLFNMPHAESDSAITKPKPVFTDSEENSNIEEEDDQIKKERNNDDEGVEQIPLSSENEKVKVDVPEEERVEEKPEVKEDEKVEMKEEEEVNLQDLPEIQPEDPKIDDLELIIGDNSPSPFPTKLEEVNESSSKSSSSGSSSSGSSSSGSSRSSRSGSSGSGSYSSSESEGSVQE